MWYNEKIGYLLWWENSLDYILNGSYMYAILKHCIVIFFFYLYHDKIGILLTTEQFSEDDVDEVKGDNFPFLLNNNLFQRENEERGPPNFRHSCWFLHSCSSICAHFSCQLISDHFFTSIVILLHVSLASTTAFPCDPCKCEAKHPLSPIFFLKFVPDLNSTSVPDSNSASVPDPNSAYATGSGFLCSIFVNILLVFVNSRFF